MNSFLFDGQMRTIPVRLAITAILSCCIAAISVQGSAGAPTGMVRGYVTSSVGYQRPTLVIPFCSMPPKIDGVLDDPCWKSAAHISQFYRMISPVTQQTEVWVCADTKRLYVAFHCIDSQPKIMCRLTSIAKRRMLTIHGLQSPFAASRTNL
jgi:hypothetical protein